MELLDEKRSCRHGHAMWDKSFVLLMESCWAVTKSVSDIITVGALIIVCPYDDHETSTCCQLTFSHVLYIYCISIVVWSGFTVDFRLHCSFFMYSVLHASVYLFVLALSAGLCMFVAYQCGLCELSVRAAETVIRWEWRGETLCERDRWRGGTDEDPVLFLTS